jgi:hypothetical protein
LIGQRFDRVNDVYNANSQLAPNPCHACKHTHLHVSSVLLLEGLPDLDRFGHYSRFSRKAEQAGQREGGYSIGLRTTAELSAMDMRCSQDDTLI